MEAVNAWTRRCLPWLVYGVALAVSGPGFGQPARSDAIAVHGGVTTLPAGGMIRERANLFDLEGTTVTFTPSGTDGYAVAVGDLNWREPGADARTVGPDLGGDDYLTVDLPFSFPFADRQWTRVYANRNGNISFRQPENEDLPERNHDSMRAVAAAIDSRSAVGLEAAIAALWAQYDRTTVSIVSGSDQAVITWRVVRFEPYNEHGYRPLGENLFQARLYPSGTIELAYHTVAERDGIVGLFDGRNPRSSTLDALSDPRGDVAHPELDITRVEWVDGGSVMIVRLTFAGDVPPRVPDGEIGYRVFLHFGASVCDVGVAITSSGRRSFGVCDEMGSNVGYRVQGATVEIAISKTFLSGMGSHFTSDADAVWWGRDAYDQLRGSRRVNLNEPRYDLDKQVATVEGNLFEVFHYPTLRSTSTVIASIYEQALARDELVVPFTDFRMDHFGNASAGTGPINDPVSGIGDWQADPTPGTVYGSDNLLVSMRPAFIGTPAFAYAYSFYGHPQHNFAPGIGWVAHELVHRWAVHLRFRNPRTGRIETLTSDDGCDCHWSDYLHAPVTYPVWAGFSTRPYAESSLMGGFLWRDNGDGTFTHAAERGIWPVGLSALDLYVMGMIPASEVPDTFLLTNVEHIGYWPTTVRATKVPVRIEDVVAAMGPRAPAADAAQREFKLGIYLLHEDDRAPRADLLRRARGIVPAVSEYFERATDGRMRVVPTAGPAPEPPPADGDCVAGEETLCLQNGRFEVTVDWWTADGEPTSALVAPKGTDDSGLFRFFDPTNWEMLIKVLDGCAVNEHVWVYGASTTDLGYSIRVRDTVANTVARYRNEAGEPARAITDNKAFPAACGEGSPTAALADGETGARLPEFHRARSPLVVTGSGSGCTESGTSLCLADGRFEVTVDWSTADGRRGSGGTVPGTNNSGLFYFFGKTTGRCWSRSWTVAA